MTTFKMLVALVITSFANVASAQSADFVTPYGRTSVHAIPFGDAVSRVIVDVEASSGTKLAFETLMTLRGVSVTAYGPEGFTSLTEQCGNLVVTGGTTTASNLRFWIPEMDTTRPALKSAPTGAAGIRTACGSCSLGLEASCRSCADLVVASFALAADSCLGQGTCAPADQKASPASTVSSCDVTGTNGDGSDNGTGGGGGSTDGDGSDNGTGGGGGSTEGDGSDNGTGGGGTSGG